MPKRTKKDDMPFLPEGHPFRARKVDEQWALLDQVAGMRENANQMENAGYPMAAARARTLADALESGSYFKH